MYRILPLFLLLAQLPTLAFDIAPRPWMRAGAGLAVKSKQAEVPVAMSREWVDLYPAPGKMRVHVTFELINRSDRSCSFDVGFPSYFDRALENFRARVDGEERLFELVQEEKQGRRKTYFQYWLCWKMDFQPRQKVEVVVDYEVATGPFRLAPSDQHLPKAIREKLFWHRSGYVLQTGAAWHGPIERAELRVHYSDQVSRDRLRILKPRAKWVYDAERNLERCVLENIEPDSSTDVRLEFRSLSPTEEINLLEETLKTQILRPAAWGRLINLIEAHSQGPAAKERVVAILEGVLPPSRPEPNWGRIYSSRDRELYRRAFVKLCQHYSEKRSLKKLKELSRIQLRLIEVCLAKENRKTKPSSKLEELKTERNLVLKRLARFEKP